MEGWIQALAFLAVGAVLLLGSGFGIVGLVGPLRRCLSRSDTIAVSLLLSSGLAGLLAAAGRLAGLEIGAWSVLLLVISLGLAVAGILRMRAVREARPPHGGFGRWRAVPFLLAALVFVLMLPSGGSLGPVHDSLDFVAFVRETIETGDLAPRSPIYRVDEDVPPDMRRGSFHTEIAALCWLTGVEPTDAWRWSPRLLAPLALIALAAMLRAWIGGGAAILATILFAATTFFSYDRFLHHLGYASRFGWICGWGALLALGRASEMRHASARAETRALLAVAALGPLLLVSVHLLSGFQTLLAIGCAALALWCSRDTETVERRRLFIMLAAATLLLAPAALLRVGGSTGVANPLFDHLYGVMLVAPGWPVLLPSYVSERFGPAGIAGAILGLWLLLRARTDRAAGFLGVSTLVPLAILFLPPIVRIVVDAHAHSMLFRVILTIPFAGSLAYAAALAIPMLRRAAAGRRAGGAIVLGVIAAGIVLQISSTRSSWAVPEKYRADYRESEPLVHAMAFLEERFPKSRTILTDPISSYAIPAYTRHDAVAPYHQHSSPTDGSVDDRIRDVQEALNGRIGLERTFRIIRRYHADLILLNQSYKRYASAYYIRLSPLAYEEQRSKFDSRPDLFEAVYDRDGIRIYQINDPGPATPLGGDAPVPERIGDLGTQALFVAGPSALLEIQPTRSAERAGDTLEFDTVWRRTAAPYRLPVVCDIKVQAADLPAGYGAPIVGRLRALIEERSSGRTIRFGRSFRPLVDLYPDFLWAPGETYRDRLALPIPPHARPGRYAVYARLREEPYAPVIELSEQWSLSLGEDWTRIAEIEILP